jgi:hypothetical protein
MAVADHPTVVGSVLAVHAVQALSTLLKISREVMNIENRGNCQDTWTLGQIPIRIGDQSGLRRVEEPWADGSVVLSHRQSGR